MTASSLCGPISMPGKPFILNRSIKSILIIREVWTMVCVRDTEFKFATGHYFMVPARGPITDQHFLVRTPCKTAQTLIATVWIRVTAFPC